MSEPLAERDWLPWGPDVRLVGSHPCGLLAVDKPMGVLSHPNEDAPPEELERALLQAPYDHERECYHDFPNAAAPPRVHLLHRLDSATSGLLLLATNDAVADAVRRRFQSHDVEKIYHAIVRFPGRAGMHGLWVDAMEKGRRGKQGPVFAAPGAALQARTQYSWVRGDSYRFGLSLMQLTPLTGRTHQLRYQCMVNGMPIVGDRNYGDYRFNRKVRAATGLKRLFLHASGIKVRFMHGSEVIKFAAESPLPPEFEGILGKNETWIKNLTRQPTAGEIAERKRAQIRDSLRGPHARKSRRRHRHG